MSAEQNTSGSGSNDQLHQHWDKVVSAAYLRLVDGTQEEAATAVGRSARTIRNWESDKKLWKAACEEARGRWLFGAEAAARKAFLDSLQLGNAELAKWLLERIDEVLAPPKSRLEHSGEIGGGTVNVYLPDNKRDDPPEPIRKRMAAAGTNGTPPSNGNGKR